MRGHRLIPAHAGKTRSVSSAVQELWAHPRSRGENLFPSSHRWSTNGSSPLTRGKRGRGLGVHWSVRLIPAHAGKTGNGVVGCHGVGAHPRSRGENPKHPNPGQQARGSSPLTRGKLPRPPPTLVSEWLIPAHAGKTTD